ncbi:hypothetical protein FRC11_002005, partial [Ceratobasidium sp. 423]
DMEHNDTIIWEILEEYYHNHLESLLNLAKVDPTAVDHIQTCMYQCAIKQVLVKPATTIKSKSMAGSHVLSIKDIICLKPKPTVDCKDDMEGSESKTTEGQGTDSKDKEGDKAGEVGKEEGEGQSQSQSKQGGSKDKGADTNVDVDANADAKDEDEGREIQVELVAVPTTKQWVVKWWVVKWQVVHGDEG